MILSRIQHTLQYFYHFEIEQDVENFIIGTDLPKTNPPAKKIGSRLGSEALLVKQVESENQIELGLYVAPAILTLLAQHDPYQTIRQHNLKAFLLAAEGVSHFVYFLNKVAAGKSITQLELELQAEIDKYLLVCYLYLEQINKIPPLLLQLLFEQINWQPALGRSEKIRYQEANRLATKFCAYLDQNYLRYQRWPKALEHARYFYHLDHWQKMARLTP